MQKLEKLRLKGISEILSEKELKNVVGGSSLFGCGSIGNCNGPCLASSGNSGTCQWYFVGGYDISNMYCACVVG